MDHFGLGKRIAYLRTLKQLRQIDLADLSGLSVKQIGRIERGTSDSSIVSIKKIAKALDTNVFNLFVWSTHESQRDINPSPIISVNNVYGSILLNRRSGRMIWSKNIYTLLGRKPYSLKLSSTKCFLRFVTSEHRKACRSFFAGVMKGDLSINHVIHISISRKQETRHLELHTDAISDGGGSDSEDILITVRDVTELCSVDKTLKQNQEQLENYIVQKNMELSTLVEKYRHEMSASKSVEKDLRSCKIILSNSFDGVALVDNRYHYKFANTMYRKYLGETHCLKGHNIFDVLFEKLGPEYEELVRPNLEKAFAGESVSYQHWHESPLLGRRYVKVYYTPVLRPNHSWDVSITIHDLTESKLTQEVYQNIVNSASEVILKLDADHRIIYANPTSEHFFGYPSDRIIGKNSFAFLHPEERESIKLDLPEIIKGNLTRYKTRVLRGDGFVAEVLASVAPDYDDDGKFKGSTVIVADISRIKKAKNLFYNNN